MDAFEAAKVVHDRIKELEPRAPEWMTRYILLTQIPEQELIRLALGPNSSILNLIQKLHNASLLVPPIMAPFSTSYGSYFDAPKSSRYGGVDQRCRYFNKGYCKHGSNCRYYHDESFGDGDEFDQLLYYGALKKLELEVVHLLKSQRGCPVSIATLPMMYYDKYGRSLQAEGYLSESQRHGKAGYSLTKLLARLNAIRLIDRPHGQHAVVLAKDAPKYMDMQGERNEYDPSGFRQIYLTFPPKSTFSEEDVANYFNKFGAVEDVRIPWQERRMFGFVTFVSANTVKWILSKGSPHYVCGARVLAKPYREKSKLAQRKYLERFDSCTYPVDHIDLRLPYRPYKEEHENALELEMSRLSQLQLATQGYLTVPQDCDNTNLYTINNDCTDEDQESDQGLNLPDRPFESP